MKNYSLQLTSNKGTLVLPLSQIESDDLLYDYTDKVSNDYIHNDLEYSVLVADQNGELQYIEQMYVNNELVEDRKVLNGKNAGYLFLECFGIIKIELVVNGLSFATPNIRIVMKEEAISKNIVNMIDYIYDNCNDYLYEEHKNSKTTTGTNPSPNVSIDTKLALLNEIYDVYVKGYSVLKYSAQTKLVTSHKIGNFNELQIINQNTINHIVNHPEELQPINYNSGISVNRQYYEPRKTLVQSVAYSFDIYENQVVIGFLISIIRDLDEILFLIEEHQSRNTSPYRRNGYIDSSYFIYTRNVKMLNNYHECVLASQEKFKKLLFEYKKIINIREAKALTTVPKFTNIFRRIMPYNAMFECILKWFNCGNYDLAKSDLLLSFVSISKIYEYFGLLKINRSLESCGFSLSNGYSYKYDEFKYYRNTTYNNTFEYQKDNTTVTVYYQPIIYGNVKGRDRPNNIGLLRNTSLSLQKPSYVSMLEDDRKLNTGNCYVPDYLIKFNQAGKNKYFILDAKHSTPQVIKREQLRDLIYKYLFSISSLTSGTSVDGLCILCGKGQKNKTESIYDISDALDIPVFPSAKICLVSGDDVNNNEDLEKYFENIEMSFC